MKNFVLTVSLFTISLTGAGFTYAQQHNHSSHNHDKPAATAKTEAPKNTEKEMVDAEVRKVDKDAKKVTLKHGPIKSMDMPGMTMVFQVRDDKLFDKLVAGEKIKFSVEQQQGAYVITSVEKEATK